MGEVTMKHKWYNESWKWGGRDFICKKYEDAIHTKCASDRFNRVTRPKYVNNILFRMKARREKDSYASTTIGESISHTATVNATNAKKEDRYSM